MTDKMSSTVRLLITYAIFVMIAFVVGLLYSSQKLNFGLGMLFGGVMTIVRLIVMEITIRKSLEKAPEAASLYAKRQYFLRYLLTFIVILVGATVDAISVFGVAISLLLLKPAAYVQYFFEPEVPKDGSVEFLEWEDDDEENTDF